MSSRSQVPGLGLIFWGPPFKPRQPPVGITLAVAATPIQGHTDTRTQHTGEYEHFAHVCTPTVTQG